MTETRCVLVHRLEPERPRPASVGLLCTGHYLGLEQTLADLPVLSAETDESLVKGSSAGQRVAGNPETALPFDDKLSDAHRKVRDLLASWSSIVVEEHPDGLHFPRFGIGPCSAFLTTHLEWISAQLWVDDLHGEITDARKALYAALTPSRTRRVSLGPCEAPVACDVATGAVLTCQGIMQAVVHANDEALPPVIGCAACGISLQPWEWRALSKRLRGGLDPMLTLLQISQTLQVPARTLKRWAAEDEWRRQYEPAKHGQRARYHLDDAQRSFEAHSKRQEAS